MKKVLVALMALAAVRAVMEVQLVLPAAAILIPISIRSKRKGSWSSVHRRIIRLMNSIRKSMGQTPL